MGTEHHDDWGRTLEDTRALATDAGGNLVRRRGIVRVVEGPSAGAEAALERESLVIGSGESADLVVRDPRVSRMHVELSLHSQGVRVRDLGSRNGTFVGDARVQAIVVPLGTHFRLGRSTLDVAAADVVVPLAPSARTHFGTLVGSSPVMRRMFAVLERTAPSDAAVCLFGEPGAGKTAAALAIHEESGRRGQARVVDVRAGVDEQTLAHELAIAGTLVLEHVDRASARTSAALVAALEARDHGTVSARLVSTAREDPRALAEAGAFPRDLYFHLAPVRVAVPALRDHSDDVPMLVEALTPPHVAVPHRELDRLRAEGFPGNVRTLRAVLAAASGPARDPRSAPTTSPLTFREAKQAVVDRFERQYLARLLEEHAGNVSRAAREAGVARSHFITLLEKHALG